MPSPKKFTYPEIGRKTKVDSSKRYLLAITGAAILVVVGSSNSLAGPGRITSSQAAQKHAAHDKEQPFHAEITGTVSSSTPSSNPCVLNQVGRGSGVVNIGSDSIEVSFEAITVTLRRPACKLVTAPQVGEFTAFHIFTAENGDILVAHAHATGINQPDGTTVFSGSFNFSGGTGQFAGAQGHGDITTSFPTSTPLLDHRAVYDGEITFRSNSK